MTPEVSVVEDNLTEGGHLKLLKLAEGKCLNRLNVDEIPLVSRLQDRRSLFNVCLIDRVLYFLKQTLETMGKKEQNTYPL